MRSILRTANARPADILSKRSRVYQSRRDDIDAMSDDELIVAMIAEPTLIRRPLIVEGDLLIVGFDKKGLATLADRETGTE